MEKYLVLAMFLQFILPFITLWLLLRKRVQAIKSKSVSIKYFKAYQANEIMEEDMVVCGRHYSNLFEMPVLFFVGSLLYLHFHYVDTVSLFLAYSYVVVRMAHSWVHLTSNNVLHRFRVFAVSNLILMAFWLNILGKNFQIF